MKIMAKDDLEAGRGEGGGAAQGQVPKIQRGMRKHTDEDLRQAAQLYDSGLSMCAIRKKMCPESKDRKWVSKAVQLYGKKRDTHLSEVDRFMSYVHPEPNSGCWIWIAGLSSNGYGMFYNTFRRKVVSAHRASYEMFIGPVPKDLLVCHKCDSRFCVNPDHLFVGTSFDNVTDCKHKGRERHVSGEENGRSKLKLDDVKTIRSSLMNIAGLAYTYNVDEKTIRQILEGKTWKGVSNV